MDNRPGKGTAIVMRRQVEALVQSGQFDITLIHKERVPEDELYKTCHEIIIPTVRLPKFSGFFSELWFFLTARTRYDIFYFPHSRLYPTFWLAPAKKIAFAAMDGGPQTSGYKVPVKGKQPWYIRPLLRYVDVFIAISEFGKEGIAKTYHVPLQKIARVYNGVDERCMPLEDTALIKKTLTKKYGFPQEPFILDVSRFDPHKNILGVIEAYHILRTTYRRKEKLVFVGGRHIPSYAAEVDALIAKYGLTEYIFIAPFIEDADLPHVYNAAELVVFPSFYEGFGLPVVEAMACGVPVVISHIPALVEVAGDAAMVVDPYSTQDMAKGFLRALTDDALRARLTAEGLTRAKLFSWEASGRALTEALRALV